MAYKTTLRKRGEVTPDGRHDTLDGLTVARGLVVAREGAHA